MARLTKQEKEKINDVINQDVVDQMNLILENHGLNEFSIERIHFQKKAITRANGNCPPHHKEVWKCKVGSVCKLVCVPI